MEWASYWHRNDLWVERGFADGINKIHLSQTLLSRAEFETSGFYQDWLRKLDIYHMVGSVFPIEPDFMAVIGIHRPRNALAFEESDCRRLASFLPHLRRTLAMQRRLAASDKKSKIAFDVFAGLETGVAIVDAKGRLLEANGAAEAVLRCGVPLKMVNGRLTASAPNLKETFSRLLRQAITIEIGEPSDGVISFPRLGRLPVVVSAEPLSSRWNDSIGTRPAVMLFICDPESPVAGLGALRRLYGLTPTEASIALTLASGKSPEDIADTYRIGIGTVRSHIKKILSKTGTRRQAQLVALILRTLPAVALQFERLR